MPRKPRVFVAGGTHYVSCRVARGEDVTLIGVEQCGLKVKDLAVVIGRGAGSASRLYSEAAILRRTNSAFAAIAEQVTETLRERQKKSSRRQSMK